MKTTLNAYLKYLEEQYPLTKHTVEITLYSMENLPTTLTVDNVFGKPVPGMAQRRGTHVTLSLATRRPLPSVLRVLAHEYRHAWQYDNNMRIKMEMDAFRFSYSTTKEFCRKFNIPTPSQQQA